MTEANVFTENCCLCSLCVLLVSVFTYVESTSITHQHMCGLCDPRNRPMVQPGSCSLINVIKFQELRSHGQACLSGLHFLPQLIALAIISMNLAWSTYCTFLIYAHMHLQSHQGSLTLTVLRTFLFHACST